jgi:YtkA-like
MRWLLGLAVLVSTGALAQKIDGKLDCRYTGKDFIYDCTIRLDPPMEGVQVTVGADMPSMPMAHSVKPEKAQETKTPGEYRAKLDLEMPGEWAVKLRLAGPVRDQLVLHYEFDERGARPVRRSAKSPRK